MADRTGYSNSVRAGALLLTTLVGALVILIVLSKASIFTRKNHYTVQFRMSDGVAGLDVGSEVRVAGLKVGRVTGISEHFADDRIDVAVEMDAKIPVYKDAQAMRAQPLLGNFSWINFTTLGTSAAGQLKDDETLWATPSGGLLATIVGPQNAGRANQMFSDLVAFTGSLNDFATVQYPKRVVPILDDASTVVRNLRGDYETWRPDITSTLSNAASATKKLDATMDDAKVLAADARAAVAHIREKNLDQVDKILGSAEQGAKSFADAMDSLDTELVTRLPDVRAMLWDLRQASAQIKLASMEVRRSPWKLLYRPSGDELARENLYESARAFAIASSDLRVAGDTLRAAMKDAPERFEKDPKFRDAIREEVVAALGRYEAAQRKLFDVLLDGKPMPTAGDEPQTRVAAPMAPTTMHDSLGTDGAAAPAAATPAAAPPASGK